MITSRLRFVPVAAALLLGAPALAAPPTAEDVQAMFQQLNEVWAAHQGQDNQREMLEKKAAEIVADIDMSELQVEHLKQLGQILQIGGRADDGMARLAELAKQDDAEGVNAAILQLQMAWDKGAEEKKAMIAGIFSHGALNDYIATTGGGDLFGALGGQNAEVLAPHASTILGFVELMPKDIEPSAALGLGEYVNLVNALGDAATAQQKKNAHMAVVARLESAAKAAKATDERLASQIENSLKYLNGAAGRGELIDHPAPAVEFAWTSMENGPATLAALKGKVVVIDFWATWCGPCIASFPAVRELQERYNGYDVVVLGVTSLQGRHYPKGGSPVETEGNPDLEYELMAQFMKNNEMTWPVAFSKDNVFNPEFGVRGIPHVAIVDAMGKTRYNGLHPSGTSLAEKAKKIDGLLKEAGLPAPAPVATEGEAGDDSAH